VIPNEKAPTQDQSRLLTQTAVMVCTERLTSEALKRGGYLTIGDINQLSHIKTLWLELLSRFRQPYNSNHSTLLFS
jgi:hypothetical protein